MLTSCSFDLFEKFIINVDERNNVVWFKVWDSKLRTFRYFDYDYSCFPNQFHEDCSNSKQILEYIRGGNCDLVEKSLISIIAIFIILKRGNLNGYITKGLMEQANHLCHFVKLNNYDGRFPEKIKRLVEVIENKGENIQI